MAVMASWNGKTWGVSSQRIAALNGVSHSVELDTENSDDKAGSPATKTKALKLQSKALDDTQVAKFSGHLTVSHKVESEVV